MREIKRIGLLLAVMVLFAACKTDEVEPPSYTVTYTVAYHANGGSGTMADSAFTCGEAQTLRANAFTRSGYVFMGWAETPTGEIKYVNGESVIDLATENGAVVTLYAVWGVNMYIVRYDANGGDGEMTASGFTPGVPQALKSNTYTREGYTFTGWSRTETGAAEFVDGANALNLAAVGETVFLYAVWRGNSYTVVYNANGGGGDMESSSFTYGEEQALRANAFALAGHAFTGWARTAGADAEFADGATVSNLTGVAGATVTLYAKWATAYEVHFDADGGVPAPPPQMVIGGGRADEPPGVTKEGHAFDGWYRDGGSGGVFTVKWDFDASTVTGDMTLFAKWVPAYTVTFYADGGTPDPAPLSVRHGGTVTPPPDMAKSGYIFIGWYRDAQLLNEYDFNAPVTGPATLYAKWSLFYYVAYDANGGGGSMERTTHGIDIPQALRANTFTRYGCTFMGWALSPEGAVVYTDRQSVTGLTAAGETVTLYAVWYEYIIRVPGATLGDKNDWLYFNIQTGGEYLLEFSADESFYILPVLSWSNVRNVIIRLRGVGEMRTFSLLTNGSMFTVVDGVTLVLDENITLQGRAGNTAPLVRVNSGGRLIINSGSVITGNTNSSSSASTSNYAYGGGVYVDSNGTFTMNGGEISGNTAYSSNSDSYTYSSTSANAHGGGVYVASNGTFTMSGGKISGNTASSSRSSTTSILAAARSYGGGVYVESNGIFTMTGGEISSNTSSATANTSNSISYGGGVASNGTFTMNGGEISGNTVRNIGGGVWGSLTMNGGKISGNISGSSGGGVSGNLTMNGGEISGNRAYYGGGVSSGTFTMTGGEISRNTASGGTSSSGGGVSVSNTFTKTGGTITGYASDPANGNVVRNGSGAVQSDRGHAVYVDSGSKRRETTAGPAVNMNSTVDGAAGGWE